MLRSNLSPLCFKLLATSARVVVVLNMNQFFIKKLGMGEMNENISTSESIMNENNIALRHTHLSYCT